MSSLAFKLPWPPSSNMIWRTSRINGRQRTYLTMEAKSYRQEVAYHYRTDCGLGDSRLAIVIYATPKDKRKRDLDNLLKSPIDALMACGVFTDDSQVDKLEIIRLPSDKEDPHLWVQISEIEVDHV